MSWISYFLSYVAMANGRPGRALGISGNDQDEPKAEGMPDCANDGTCDTGDCENERDCTDDKIRDCFLDETVMKECAKKCSAWHAPPRGDCPWNVPTGPVEPITLVPTEPVEPIRPVEPIKPVEPVIKPTHGPTNHPAPDCTKRKSFDTCMDISFSNEACCSWTKERGCEKVNYNYDLHYAPCSCLNSHFCKQALSQTGCCQVNLDYEFDIDGEGECTDTKREDDMVGDMDMCLGEHGRCNAAADRMEDCYNPDINLTGECCSWSNNACTELMPRDLRHGGTLPCSCLNESGCGANSSCVLKDSHCIEIDE